ncbi:MAG: Glycosyltransferase [uncultured Sulfurovum sp.]|uniref:Glycosyltransferase n=1 Tax=uncultured Sulfurovum sp. TaxID=269237 RepID=A0A6S6SGN9_9BACT|nr:MAG: Glycosyltransferase [uncultured Sulfurovum sp.]
MNKMLFITDQEQYSSNGTITTLFDKYLKEYWEVDIVYITSYKHTYQRIGNELIVPKKYQNEIIEYLSTGNDLTQYDFIFVRNKKEVLENVLKHKEEYNYKVGYRVSYPKQHHALELSQSFTPSGIFNRVKYTMKIKKRDELANHCDLFLPPSPEAHQAFFPNIQVKSFPLFIGLDPEKLTEHKSTESDVVRFINVGTMDQLREFDVVLDAFEKIELTNWHLEIVVSEKGYIRALLSSYPKLSDKITLHEGIDTLEKLRNVISKNDVGIALLPSNVFHNTVIANKVIHYASCGLPSLMIDNDKNRSVFNEDETYFSSFDVDSIADTLNKTLSSSKEELLKTGRASQEKLLAVGRNYQDLARDLAKTMDDIVNDETPASV